VLDASFVYSYVTGFWQLLHTKSDTKYSDINFGVFYAHQDTVSMYDTC